MLLVAGVKLFIKAFNLCFSGHITSGKNIIIFYQIKNDKMGAFGRC